MTGSAELTDFGGPGLAESKKIVIFYRHDFPRNESFQIGNRPAQGLF
jgi:hypothetical protein